MSERLLPCVELEPDREARAAVVWLHGLGADGHDFEPIVPHLGLPPALGVRFVFPHAPRMPVTLNSGMVMPAWFDIGDLDFDRRADDAGIRRSAEQISRLVDREVARGIPSERIVLAGFSQGGVIALHHGLRRSEKLAGIVALSTYLAAHESLEAEAAPSNRTIPIWMAHGRHDPLVPFERGEQSRRRLEALGYRVEFHSYEMAHEVCMPEIAAIGAFLRERLA